MKRCYRMVIGAEAFDRLGDLDPQFVAYMATLATKPRRWETTSIGASIDIRAVADRKWHAMEAHATQQQDLDRFERFRDKIDLARTAETFIRAFPEPGGPPLETDLFAAVRRPATR